MITVLQCSCVSQMFILYKLFNNAFLTLYDCMFSNSCIIWSSTELKLHQIQPKKSGGVEYRGGKTYGGEHKGSVWTVMP